MSAEQKPTATPSGESPSPLLQLAFGGHRLTAILLITDLVMFSLLWLFAYEIRYFFNAAFGKPINELRYYAKALLLVVPIWLLVTALWGHYQHRERLSSLAQTAHLLGAAKDGLLATFAVAFLLRNYELGRSVVLMSLIFNFTWLYTSRTVLRALRQRALSEGLGRRRALVVGTGETARRVIARIASHPEIGYELVGVLSINGATNGARDGSLSSEQRALKETDSGKYLEAELEPEVDAPEGQEAIRVSEPVLGSANDLPKVIERERIEEVFLAAPQLDNDALLNLIARSEHPGVAFKICANMMEVITDRVKVDDINDLPVIEFATGSLSPWQRGTKRALDLIVAGGLLLIFALPMLAITLLIRLRDGAPVFFRQERVGLNGELFTIIKFRTMSTKTEQYDVAPTDPLDQRITPLGRWLRKTSLDELPQLWNVVRGDMSMVGPRPEMPFIVEKYQEWERRRLSVRPGITGLWQIIGRKNLPLAQHLEYDFYYIKNQSLVLDLLIILRTVPAVVFGKGAF
jgi:lipopolysaccharide/colanic/teichoic acid biosynthesis glycosyltransferase